MRRGAIANQQTAMRQSIVALLFGLAATAEIAAVLPAPVRLVVFFILRRAERCAFAYVYWTAHGCGLTLQWLMPVGWRADSSPAGLLELGVWLRALALSLRDLPRRAFIQKMRFGGIRANPLPTGAVRRQAQANARRNGLSGLLPAIRAGPLSAAL